MTADELNFDLYTKMEREMIDFAAWLQSQPPDMVQPTCLHLYERWRLTVTL